MAKRKELRTVGIPALAVKVGDSLFPLGDASTVADMVTVTMVVRDDVGNVNIDGYFVMDDEPFEGVYAPLDSILKEEVFTVTRKRDSRKGVGRQYASVQSHPHVADPTSTFETRPRPFPATDTMARTGKETDLRGFTDSPWEQQLPLGN